MSVEVVECPPVLNPPFWFGWGPHDTCSRHGLRSEAHRGLEVELEAGLFLDAVIVIVKSTSDVNVTVCVTVDPFIAPVLELEGREVAVSTIQIVSKVVTLTIDVVF